MIKDTTIKQFIDDRLIEDNDKREQDHKASGKLSASMLYQPVRFQVLKTIGVPRKAFDPYTLGLFKRGRDVENWYVSELDAMGVLLKKQGELKYRDAVGFVDAVVTHESMQFKHDVIPHEVKSVKNAKLKRIAKTGVDWHYKIQACFYALAMDCEYYSVDIVSAEDYQVDVNIFPTHQMKRAVDDAISAYDNAMVTWNKHKMLPKFAPNPQVKWTANIKYAMFDEKWVTASDTTVIKYLEEK